MLLFSACSQKSSTVVKEDINKTTEAVKDKNETLEPKSNSIKCLESKGNVCIQVFDPVCAKSVLDKHVSYETASNGCMACLDKKVISYTKGECPTFIKCKDKRPDMSTKIYKPVCAKVDTGIRCIKEPCPATEFKTFSNGCTACQNPKVFGYMKGGCR